MPKRNKKLQEKISKVKSELLDANKSKKRAKKKYQKAVEKCMEKNKGLRSKLREAKRQERKLAKTFKKLQEQLKAKKKKEIKAKQKAASKKDSVKETNKNDAAKAIKKAAAKKVNAIKASVEDARAKLPNKVPANKFKRKTTTTKPQIDSPTWPKSKATKPPKRPSPQKSFIASHTKHPKSTGNDNFKIIEGVGPAIERHLKAAGIKTYSQLAKMSVKRLREVLLKRGGSRYSVHDPTHWAQQARLAAAGKRKELKNLQQELKGSTK